MTKAGAWDTNYTPYAFKDEAPLSQRPVSQTVHIDFSADSEYSVDWMYNPTTNVYMRNNGGAPHIDRDTNKQLSTKNIVLLFMAQSNAQDGYMGNEHLLYQDTGSGKALIFLDGKETKGIWKKASRTAELFIYDASGNPVTFDRGQLWFSILPLDATVSVK